MADEISEASNGQLLSEEAPPDDEGFSSSGGMASEDGPPEDASSFGLDF